jgi:hypothetical protein
VRAQLLLDCGTGDVAVVPADKPINRGHEESSIRREIQPFHAAREDDAGDIAGTHMVANKVAHDPRDLRRILRPHASVVEHPQVQAAVGRERLRSRRGHGRAGREGVGGDAHRHATRWQGQIDEGEISDRLPRAIFEDLKVVLHEVANQLAFAVQHADG